MGYSKKQPPDDKRLKWMAEDMNIKELAGFYHVKKKTVKYWLRQMKKRDRAIEKAFEKIR